MCQQTRSQTPLTTTQTTQTRKKRSNLLREKHLNWVKNILNSQSIKNAKGPENVSGLDFFLFPERRWCGILFKELSESTFGDGEWEGMACGGKSAFHLAARAGLQVQFQREFWGLLLSLQWKPGPECLFAGCQPEVINSIMWKKDSHWWYPTGPPFPQIL